MAFTYDVSTPRGRVRLRCRDVDAEHALFQDDEIDAFLADNDGNVLLAAADALETTANDMSLVLKVISTLDLSTNGPAVAADLRQAAAKLREQAAVEDPAFEIAEMVVNGAGYQQYVYNQALRGQL